MSQEKQPDKQASQTEREKKEALEREALLRRMKNRRFRRAAGSFFHGPR
jgi:hypothetical protein